MRNPGRLLVSLALAVLVALLVMRFVVGIYTEVLWYQQLQYASVFWTRWWTDIIVRLVAAVIGAAVVFGNLWIVARRLGPVQVRRRYGNIEISEQIPRNLVVMGITLTAVMAGWWLASVKYGGGGSLTVLTWLRRVSWGVSDPLFNHDLSFYVFALPAYLQLLDFLLLMLLWTLILCVLSYVLVGGIRVLENRLALDFGARLHVVLLMATLLLILGARFWVGRYGIMLDGTGINGGLGYTDVHARLPGERIIALLCMITAGTIIFSALRQRWAPAIASAALLVIGAITLGFAYPAFIQKFRVDPNEFAFEEPYIRWNIDFTRRAYGLDRITPQDYAYRRPDASAEEITRELQLAPVWDSEPLQTALNQVQAFFRYYHFNDVDKDRYGGQQVAISVREFQASGLSENARTWQNLHFDPKYIRGLGAVVVPATVITHGEPPEWLSNVNPIERAPEAPAALELSEPSIYFGETMDQFAVIRESTQLPVPSTAVPITSLARVVAFAWRFADKNLLFTGDLVGNSHIIYKRRITERVRSLAPFVLWDTDPYPIIDQGRVIWMIDGYTATNTFPIARSIGVEGAGAVRYLRNSVKATIDAVSGEVVLYAYDEQDPVLRTWARAFPELFRPGSQMPAELRAHVRYPMMYLRTQAQVLAQYHLDQPDEFYRGEDVWQIPGSGESRGGNVAEFSPVYQMMKLPGEDDAAYVLGIPFIARERRNMTALLVVHNDPERYGELLMYELPRNQLIAGPGQVETLVEQDPLISQQLTLWRQAGSDVSLGRPRIMPIDSGFIYMIPLFISAQGSPIPELQRILISDGSRVGMAPSLEEAVSAVFGGAPPRRVQPGPSQPELPRATAPADMSQRALELLDQAEQALRAGDYAGFGRYISQLREYLRSQ